MPTSQFQWTEIGQRNAHEEHTGAPGLIRVGVVEHGAERVLVQLHRSRTRPATDGSAGIVVQSHPPSRENVENITLFEQGGAVSGALAIEAQP